METRAVLVSLDHKETPDPLVSQVYLLLKENLEMLVHQEKMELVEPLETEDPRENKEIRDFKDNLV